ncbi:MAG: winged helix-turn-helix domain-containing protein [Anaerolineales bacterium]
MTSQDTKSGERERVLLEEIERDPDTTQADLATTLGVAVGTVNWHVKRLIAKGYVKVKRAERRKLRYIITPEGIALRARLTVAYIDNSMQLYRKSRKLALDALADARAHGYRSIRIEGDGDIADVVRLTCIEQGFDVVTDGRIPGTGLLVIDGGSIRLQESDYEEPRDPSRELST